MFIATTVDRPIIGPEVGLLFLSSNGLFDFTKSVASSKWVL